MAARMSIIIRYDKISVLYCSSSEVEKFFRNVFMVRATIIAPRASINIFFKTSNFINVTKLKSLAQTTLPT